MIVKPTPAIAGNFGIGMRLADACGHKSTPAFAFGLTVALVSACAESQSELDHSPDVDGGVADGGARLDAGAPADRITYEFLGPEVKDIEEVHIVGDRLFAATRTGLYWALRACSRTSAFIPRISAWCSRVSRKG